jgi:hypothetical protein
MSVSPTPSEDREALIAQHFAIALAAIEGLDAPGRKRWFGGLAAVASICAKENGDEAITLEGLVSRYAVIQSGGK